MRQKIMKNCLCKAMWEIEWDSQFKLQLLRARTHARTESHILSLLLVGVVHSVGCVCLTIFTRNKKIVAQFTQSGQKKTKSKCRARKCSKAERHEPKSNKIQSIAVHPPISAAKSSTICWLYSVILSITCTNSNANVRPINWITHESIDMLHRHHCIRSRAAENKKQGKMRNFSAYALIAKWCSLVPSQRDRWIRTWTHSRCSQSHRVDAARSMLISQGCQAPSASERWLRHAENYRWISYKISSPTHASACYRRGTSVMQCV